jgi:beta-catenin-like protein 1
VNPDLVACADKETDDHELQPEKIDIPWVRRLALNFEKRISKNAELRAKFENDPQKYTLPPDQKCR